MRDRLPFQIQVASEPPINKSQHQQRTRSNRMIATHKNLFGCPLELCVEFFSGLKRRPIE